MWQIHSTAGVVKDETKSYPSCTERRGRQRHQWYASPSFEQAAEDTHSSHFSLGMRSSSKILIYIDVQKALAAGIKFWLSDNGVVLTAGDETGLLSKRFFDRVVDSEGVEIKGW